MKRAGWLVKEAFEICDLTEWVSDWVVLVSSSELDLNMSSISEQHYCCEEVCFNLNNVFLNLTKT